VVVLILFGATIPSISTGWSADITLCLVCYGDAGVTEMDCETGSMYSGDPGVDRSHLIQRITHCICSQLFLTCSFWDSVWICAIAWILTAE